MHVVTRIAFKLKKHVMDTPLVKANEALGSAFLKMMAFHGIHVH
jgi:hypothetical protein